MDTELEKVFVRHFVITGRQERATFLLNSKKKRREFFGQIDSYLRKELFVQYRVAAYDEMYDILRKNGAPDTCYLMSRYKSFDGIKMRLNDVFQNEDIYYNVDLIVCIPNKLVYYPDENFNKFLLKC